MDDTTVPVVPAADDTNATTDVPATPATEETPAEPVVETPAAESVPEAPTPAPSPEEGGMGGDNSTNSGPSSV